MSATRLRMPFFVAVGCAAGAVHFLVVILLVSHFTLAPLAANVAGWLVAFIVSFTGHRLLTFSANEAPVWRSMRRFFGVSLAGFITNEAMYAALLHLSGLRYDLLLAFVLVAVAVMTYLLSARWAFLGNPQR